MYMYMCMHVCMCDAGSSCVSRAIIRNNTPQYVRKYAIITLVAAVCQEDIGTFLALFYIYLPLARSLSLSLSLSLSISLYLYLSIYLSISLSIYLSPIYLSICSA